MSDVDLKDALAAAAGVAAIGTGLGAFGIGPLAGALTNAQGVTLAGQVAGGIGATSTTAGATAGTAGAAGAAGASAASSVIPNITVTGTPLQQPVPSLSTIGFGGTGAGASQSGAVSGAADGTRTGFRDRVFGETAAETIGRVGTVASVAGTVGSFQQSQEEARQARRARRTAQAVADVQNRRARLRTLEVGRIAQADAVARSVASGEGLGSSRTQGTVSSLGTQTAESVGNQLLQERASRSIFDAESNAARAGRRASIFGAVGSEATRLTGQDTMNRFASIFD